MDKQELIEAIRHLQPPYPATGDDVHDDAWIAGFSAAQDDIVDLLESMTNTTD